MMTFNHRDIDNVLLLPPFDNESPPQLASILSELRHEAGIEEEEEEEDVAAAPKHNGKSDR